MPSELAGAPRDPQTEALRAEDELLRTARLRLRVEVSTLVAHDLGNQLTVIRNAAQMLHDEPQKQDRNLLDLVLSSSRWALSLTRELQGLAREDDEQPCGIDCNELVREQASTLACVLGGLVTIDYDLSAGPLPAAIKASGLREILLNLALNARDAMPEGGVFHISTLRAASPDGVAGEDHGCVHLTVRDTGHGMDEETRRQAFEPHFSRKRKTRNRGLGLASVERTVSRAKGVIRLESAPGKGARFDIFLPLYEGGK